MGTLELQAWESIVGEILKMEVKNMSVLLAE